MRIVALQMDLRRVAIFLSLCSITRLLIATRFTPRFIYLSRQCVRNVVAMDTQGDDNVQGLGAME